MYPRASFLWQTYIQTIEYVLTEWYDTDKQLISLLNDTLWNEFSYDLDAHSDLNHSYLKYAYTLVFKITKFQS